MRQASPQRVSCCLPECVSTTAGVPQIAAYLLQHHISAAPGQQRTRRSGTDGRALASHELSSSNQRWAVGICYGMVTCCAEPEDKRLRSVRLRKGQLCVSHTSKSHEEDLPRWKRKFRGDLFGLDHDQIADLTVRSAVYGPSERYSIMKRQLSIWEAACPEQKIKGQHRLERLYRPIALLRYSESELNPET
jgi:hypothetical protein